MWNSFSANNNLGNCRIYKCKVRCSYVPKLQNLQNARTFGKVGCKDISTALTHVMSCSVGCVVSVLISVTVDACHRSTKTTAQG